MARFHLTPRRALILFIFLTVCISAQAIWWIVFMAGLVDEKVEIAEELGAAPQFVEQLHAQEITRQIMIGFEGLFFLLVIGGGAWLIYRALVKTEQLKFNQQNFLMAVTHELKTPLASIKIYIDTLSSPKIPSEKKTRILPRMKSDLVRLEKLVENILEAGRFERSGYRLHREVIDLSALLERLVERYRHLPWETPVEIETAMASAVQVSGDPEALSRAIEAILENAMKYNDKEHVKLHIALNRENRAARIDIVDNGLGLNRGDREAIFDRFYRVGSELSRMRPGSGLGLYLCREIVRAHGGDVIAESEGPGLGARFIMTLEAVANHEDNSAG